MAETNNAFTKATGPVSVQPGVVSSDDAIPASDIGWHLYADATVADLDTLHTDIDIDTIAFIAPETLAEDDVLDTYPFFLHGWKGSIPVPPKIGLTGSLNTRRVLHGSFPRRP